jgi:hypothetical protein
MLPFQAGVENLDAAHTSPLSVELEVANRWICRRVERWSEW